MESPLHRMIRRIDYEIEVNPLIYLVFHNQTDAMRCRNSLQANHVRGTIARPPRREQGASCAWAVRIDPAQRDRASQICLADDIHPCAWYNERGGTLE